MATWDNQRYRKTYSYYRAVPKPDDNIIAGAIPFIPVCLSNTTSTTTSTTNAITETYIDPTTIDLSPYSKMIFEVVGYTSSASGVASYALYDNTTASVLATLTTSSTTAVFLYSSELNLPTSATMYTLRAYTNNVSYTTRIRMVRLRLV